MGVRYEDPLLGGGVSKGCRGKMKEEAVRQAKAEAEVGVRVRLDKVGGRRPGT